MTAPRPTNRSTTTSNPNSAKPSVVRQSRGGSNRRGFYATLLVIALLGVGAIWTVMQRGNASSGPIIVPPLAAGAAAIKPVGYTMGNANAPIEIVEFADFECPICGQFATVQEPDVRKQLITTGLARYRLYDFQVNPGHRNSPAASLAAACADEQGKFWPMHDRLFEGQNEWNTEATDNPRPVFAGYVQQLGLDATKWGQCYDSRKYLSRIAAHAAEANRVKIHGTPNFVIGDRLYPDPMTFDQIKVAVDSARMRGTATPPVALR